MNPPEDPNGKKDDPYTIIATVKSRWKSPASIISIVLLVISLVLAIVNFITYRGISNFNVQTIDNYKIRNRPFVKFKALSIINKGKDFNPHGDSKKKETLFRLELKLENFGQFPAFIEELYIWIENVSGNSENLVIWDPDKSYGIGRFALFQNEAEPFNPQFYLGKAYIDKIKKESTVYFGFYIKYNTLGVKKGLQDGPFHYGAIYKCYDFDPDQAGFRYPFLIEKSGGSEMNPTSDLPHGAIDNNEFKQKLLPKSTQTTPTSNISPPSHISP